MSAPYIECTNAALTAEDLFRLMLLTDGEAVYIPIEIFVVDPDGLSACGDWMSVQDMVARAVFVGEDGQIKMRAVT